MAMSTDTVTEGRTVVFQKEGRIMPVDHLVDRRLENMERPHGSEDLVYRAILVVQAMQTRDCQWTGNANPQLHHIKKSKGDDF